MNQTIYKYPLIRADVQTVELPKGAKLLSVKVQGNDFCLWAMIDRDEKEIEYRNIEMIGTGNPIDEQPKDYIETVIDGMFVWHFFERLQNGK